MSDSETEIFLDAKEYREFDLEEDATNVEVMSTPIPQGQTLPITPPTLGRSIGRPDLEVPRPNVPIPTKPSNLASSQPLLPTPPFPPYARDTFKVQPRGTGPGAYAHLDLRANSPNSAAFLQYVESRVYEMPAKPKKFSTTWNQSNQRGSTTVSSPAPQDKFCLICQSVTGHSVKDCPDNRKNKRYREREEAMKMEECLAQERRKLQDERRRFEAERRRWAEERRQIHAVLNRPPRLSGTEEEASGDIEERAIEGVEQPARAQESRISGTGRGTYLQPQPQQRPVKKGLGRGLYKR